MPCTQTDLLLFSTILKIFHENHKIKNRSENLKLIKLILSHSDPWSDVHRHHFL